MTSQTIREGSNGQAFRRQHSLLYNQYLALPTSTYQPPNQPHLKPQPLVTHDANISRMLQQVLERMFNFQPKPPEPNHRERASCPTITYPHTSRMQNNSLDSVFGFPSTGGMLQLDCSNTELDFLGLPTFLPQDIPRSMDQVEEDAFCDKMRLLGARLWPSMKAWVEALIERRELEGDARKEVRVGWPSDGRGVWIISWGREDGRDLAVGREVVKRARSMDERCEVIERLGGKFYESPEECPEFATVYGARSDL